MNSLMVAKLIKLVKKYPELYDGRHKDYGDQQKREVLWNKIAKELNVKVDLCRVKWNTLRGGYRRVLRNREASLRSRKWHFEDDLSFLKDCVIDRRRSRLLPEKHAASDNEEEVITIVKEEPNEVACDALSDTNPGEELVSCFGSSNGEVEDQTRCFESSNGEAEDQAKTTKLSSFYVGAEAKEGGIEVDSVKYFFLSLAETVKTLPPLVQAHIKAEVFKTVHMAEVKYLQEREMGTGVVDHTY